MSSIADDQGYNQGFVLHPSTVTRMKRRANWLEKELHLPKDAIILEIGCGTGEVAHWIAEKTEATVIGLDTCESFIEYANEHHQLPNLQFQVLSAQDIDKNFDQVDAIVGNGILHHLEPELGEMLQVFFTHLKPGGKFVFMEPNYYNPYVFAIFTIPQLRKLAKLEPNEMAFTKPYITKLLKQAGFSDIKVTFKDFLVPGVPKILTTPLIVMGNIIERIPLLRASAQSLFISAKKK